MEKFEAINRTAIVVVPKKPFWDWVNGVEPGSESELTPKIKGEGTIYLLPEFDDEDELEKHLQKISKEVFENELMAWFTDESLWPQNRNWSMFREWFDCRIHEIVHDTVHEKVRKEQL